MERLEELSVLLSGWLCSRCKARVVPVRTGMICLKSSSPSVGSDLPLYIEVGRVHGVLGSLVYGVCAPESRRILQLRRWTWRCRGAEEARFGYRLVALF
jgi:hypothetical protein